MRWKDGRRGGNVEDRRGMSGGKLAGGGIGFVLIALVVSYFLGIDPQPLLEAGSGMSSQQQTGDVGTPEDEAGQFVDVVGTNVNDVWANLYDGYKKPNVVIYSQGTGTGCGYGQAAMGPFYCPADQTIYLDLSFWQQMETQLGASGADFARAYVIAHEPGRSEQVFGRTGTAGRLLCRRVGRPCRHGIKWKGCAGARRHGRRTENSQCHWRRHAAEAFSGSRHPRSVHARLCRTAHGVAEPRLSDRRSTPV